jgi:Protein of unknown function (DUF3723)
LVNRITIWSLFVFDQKYLFLNNIYNLPPDVKREHLTTFAVKQDIFIAFFPHELTIQPRPDEVEEDLDMDTVGGHAGGTGSPPEDAI